MANNEDTKELDNLKEIMDNPTKPALDIEKVEEVKEELNAVEETIKGIDKLSDEVKDIKEKPVKKKKDKKNSKLKEKWNKLSKKQKILTIVLGTIILILIIVLIVVLATKTKPKKTETPKKKDIIILKDNYRYENGTLVFLDKNDKDIGKYECKNQDVELCYVAFLDNEEYINQVKNIDKEGNIVLQRSPIIDNNYVLVYDNEKDVKREKIFLYDIKKKEDLGEYSKVKLATKDLLILKDTEDAYGAIKLTDDKVDKIIDFKYDYLSSYNDPQHTYFMVDDGGRNYLIDSNSNPVSKAIAMNIVDFNDNYIVGVDDTQNYYLYDYNGKQEYEDSYQYIKLYEDFVALIKDNQIYLRFYDKNKLNEVGIPLTLKYPYYMGVNVVDEDNKVVEEYVPFTIIKNDSTITVTIDKTVSMINVKEAEVSRNTDYINYFDGTLYIYGDKEKKNKIAEYKCNNSNVIGNNDTVFKNCYVASDTSKQDNDMTFYGSSGVIPIINNRYIFIQDNPSSVTDTNRTIALYDMTDKKILSRYLSVNSNLNSETEKPTYTDETSVNIIAQNKSGKYGVIVIRAGSNPGSIIPFSYSSIENIGNNYLAYDGTNYTLFDISGKDLLPNKKITNKIRGYNDKCIKVLEDGTYHLYNYQGEKLTKKGFKYIELYENYYVGISSDNKLNIYNYDKESIEIALLKDSIQLLKDNYYGDGQYAFKVSFRGNIATIEVLGADDKYTSTTITIEKKSTGNNGGV